MRITREQFLAALHRVHPQATLMLDAHVGLPQVTQFAALTLFAAGDVTSPDAQVIRHQVQQLQSPGFFDFTDAAT